MLGERSTRDIKLSHFQDGQAANLEETNRDEPSTEVDAEDVVEPVVIDRHEKQMTVNFNISGGSNSFYSNVGTVINGEVKNE